MKVSASLIALLVVLLITSIFLGFLIADYWSRQAVQKRARRKRHREIRKLKKEAMQARVSTQGAQGSDPVGADE